MNGEVRPEDDSGLAGKVAIVTGGGAPDSGIGNGRAAALLLARSGAKVVVVDILREAAEETVSMIAGEGGAAIPFVADVADESQCKALVQAAVKNSAGSTCSTTMSASAGAAASSTRRSSCGIGSCGSTSTACSLSRAMRSRQ
jgi:NAD(P)-dependent dehydrogenase (short-subunit alcohol dehydrogenase family)